ncbi:MAG: DUF4065 domain-containing protein [Bacteroidaceae bacterium]|nr:DUF4065 domain-containing protein [Bacteroidaceae bacterium]
MLFLADDGNGELMSNMKLQKMLYYQQGYHLALFDEPLFEEDLEAWMYGPVVPSVYEHYKINGSKGIQPEKSVIKLTNKEEALFNEVYRIYGVYSATGLMNLSHSEKPWNSVPTGTGNVISKSTLKMFFKKKLK